MVASPVRLPEIDFRALVVADLPRLHRWLHDAEVVRWYAPSAPSLAAVRRKYGPRIDGTSATRVYIATLDGGDAGLFQTYRFDAYRDYARRIGADCRWAGLDYYIGEPRWRGRGLAHAIIERFVADVVFAAADIAACLASTALDNVRSIRALERAGFEFLRDVESPTGLEHLLVRHRPRSALAAASEQHALLKRLTEAE
jgi:aminoglycoside 6'-N-acetyltransferase